MLEGNDRMAGAENQEHRRIIAADRGDRIRCGVLFPYGSTGAALEQPNANAAP
jgi:hypothetical protein